MQGLLRNGRPARALIALLSIRTAAHATVPLSYETLNYSIEWRLITAGAARLAYSPRLNGFESKVHLESTGLVAKLFKVDDNYLVQAEDQFCATSVEVDTSEGKKRRQTKVHFDRTQGKASLVERDLVKNAVLHTREVKTPPCVSDIIAALYKLRNMHLEPGQSAQIPVSDGKKEASIKVEAQEREQIKTGAGTFKTIRYEANVFNGVLFSKKGRLDVWLSDDAQRLPVQIRARMQFTIGTITFLLEKEEHA